MCKRKTRLNHWDKMERVLDQGSNFSLATPLLCNAGPVASVSYLQMEKEKTRRSWRSLSVPELYGYLKGLNYGPFISFPGLEFYHKVVKKDNTLNWEELSQ
jgi:hypothetical protein